MFAFQSKLFGILEVFTVGGACRKLQTVNNSLKTSLYHVTYPGACHTCGYKQTAIIILVSLNTICIHV